jgi:hypothetical protein
MSYRRLGFVVAVYFAVGHVVTAYGADPAEGAYFDGHELLGSCDAGIDHCEGYIAGVADVLSAQQAICLPRGASRKDIVYIATQYLRTHVAEKRFRASNLVTQALRDAYPCK